MRHLLANLLSFFITLNVIAQNDVTQFLGIPVDGSKSEVITKLKSKGFKVNSFNNDVLEGEFNGDNVYVNIFTNGDKVCRIVATDAVSVDERSIQIRFNNLLRQFENNSKYLTIGDNTSINSDEDLSYEINVHKKRYEANFYQRPVKMADKENWQNIVMARMIEMFATTIAEKYTEEDLANPTKELIDDYDNMMVKAAIDILSKKHVWFMISNYAGKYYISLFYDNEYNRADGEDL